MRRWLAVLLAAPLVAGCTGTVQVKASASASSGAETAAVAPGDSPTTEASRSITIRYGAATVGSKTTRRLEHVVTGHALTGKSASFTVRHVAEQSLKVLAVEGERASRLEVTFVSDETTVLGVKGKPKVLTGPLAGRTFILARGVVRPRVFASDGVPASPHDSALVSRLFPRLDEGDAFDNGGFPTGSMAIGDRVPSLEQVMAWDIGRASGGTAKVSSLTVRLADLRDAESDRQAVFSIDLAWSEAFGEIRFDGQLAGAMIYRSDGRLVSMKVKGPASIEGIAGRAEGVQELSLTETHS
ncbi:MAG: hypothetical protein HYV09_14980 [Deltaproteobacteria bacterium]|nr:hypothetical protein [Deltaproteobacteria bacterium]